MDENRSCQGPQTPRTYMKERQTRLSQQLCVKYTDRNPHETVLLPPPHNDNSAGEGEDSTQITLIAKSPMNALVVGARTWGCRYNSRTALNRACLRLYFHYGLIRAFQSKSLGQKVSIVRA